MCCYSLFIIGTRVRSTKVADYVLLLFIYYRHPCVAKVADYVLLLFIYFYFFIFFLFYFFIHRSFSETTRPIITKFSGIVYSGVV